MKQGRSTGAVLALAFALLALSSASSSAIPIYQGALIDIQTAATSFDSLSVFPSVSSDFDTVTVDTVATGEESASANSFKSNNPGSEADGLLQLSTASASGSANAATGELKASTTTSYSGYYAENSTSASSIVSLSGKYSITGSGIAFAYLDFDGSYSLSTTGFPFPSDPMGGVTVPNLSFQIAGEVFLMSGGLSSATVSDDPGNACAAAGGCQSASGTINDRLLTSLFVSEFNSSELTVTAELIMQQITGAGFTNF
jgi:hypothetical protein